MPRDWPLLFRVQGSVLRKIWLKIVITVVFSIGVILFDHHVISIPIIEATFITVLGLVIGLLLVFRTSTGYERYWEGRKIWDKMTQEIRSLTRLMWLGIKHSDDPKDLIEKRSAINLLVAFAYATKNYLRHEYSYEADDQIKQLLLHVPKLQEHTKCPTINAKFRKINPDLIIKKNDDLVTIQVPEKNQTTQKHYKLPHTQPQPQMTMSMRRKIAKAVERNTLYHAHDYITPTNIPLELAYYFHTYVNKIIIRDMFLDTDTRRLILISVNTLLNCLSEFERILKTPIPLAYSIHLHQAIWLYMLSLPFQLVAKLGWTTIPGMAIASFALFGILEIGWEIENPFGYDDNDLPLDDFCDVMKHEVEIITSHKFPTPESWMYHPENKPFAPATSKTATELSQLTLQDIWDVLESSKVDMETNNKNGVINEGFA